jgi:glutamine amidotransferase
MGWNFIEPAAPAAIIENLPPEPRFYFVHSYYLACDHQADVMCWTTYGDRFASGIHRGNLWGTQFHPEKSHSFGLALLRNFLALP